MYALVCADLADSTALVERLGDVAAADLLRRHDRMARDLLQRHGGQEIDKTDGFLLLFERAIEAVAFAVDYQHALRTLGSETSQTLRARIGVHVGELLRWDNSPEDIARGAKPVEVEGLAKPVAARLMALARPGQILLSGVAQTLAQRAASELGAQAGRLRWVMHGRYRFKGVPQPQVIHEVGEAGVAPLKAPPSGPKGWREVPLWRQPAMLAVELVLAGVVLAVALYLSFQSAPAIAFAERDWVVLGDLQNQTSDPAFDGALDTALRVGLEQSRHVNVVPNMQMQDSLRRMERPGQRVDRQIGVELAMREGARALVLPSVVEVGKQLRVNLEVIDPQSGRTVRVESAEADGPADLLPAVGRSLEGLRASLGESMQDIAQSSQPLEQITTGSLDALRAYSQVERAVAEGKVDEGIELLNMALQLDPDFAMAHARLGSALIHYRGQHDAGLASLDTALRLSARLSQRERVFLEAVHAHYVFALDTPERWGAMARLYPDVVGVRNNLGLAHAFWRNAPEDALPHFRFAGESAHPRRAESLVALAMAQLMLGQTAEAGAAFERALEVSGGAPLGQDVLVALALGRDEQVEAQLARAIKTAPPRLQPDHAVMRAAQQVDQGALEAALATLRAAESALGPANSERQRGMLVLAALAVEAELGRLDRADLEAFVAAQLARLGKAHPADRSYDLYLASAALLAQQLGFDDLAARALDSVEPSAATNGQRKAAAMAAAARCRQQPDEALACLEALPSPRWFSADAAALDVPAVRADAALAATWSARVAALRPRAIAENPHVELLVPDLLLARRAALQVAASTPDAAPEPTPPAAG